MAILQIRPCHEWCHVGLQVWDAAALRHSCRFPLAHRGVVYPGLVDGIMLRMLFPYLVQDLTVQDSQEQSLPSRISARAMSEARSILLHPEQ